MKDLHIHTSYSDGEYKEHEILDLIKKTNITEFAICDHDTIEGSKKVYNLLQNENSKLIFHTGIELSCSIPDFKGKQIDVHLLARDFDYDDQFIADCIKQMHNNRIEKVVRMKKLVKEIYNFDVPQKDIEEVMKTTNSIGKPHIYKIMSSYNNYDRETFFKNMNKLKTSDLKLNAIDVIRQMKNTQGYITLAHPIEIMEEYNMSYEDIDELVLNLKNIGLEAIETKHSKHTKKDYLEFSKIAKKHNLKETQGSDYHGPNIKPNVKLGVCEKKSK